MKTIHKFPLFNNESGIIEMPVGANILTAMLQNDVIVIYAIVHTTQEKKYNQPIHVIGTGYEMPEGNNFKYLNTLQDGRLVSHVFMEIAK